MLGQLLVKRSLAVGIAEGEVEHPLFGNAEGLDSVGDVCTMQDEREHELPVLWRLEHLWRALCRCAGPLSSSKVCIDGCSIELIEDLQLQHTQHVPQL